MQFDPKISVMRVIEFQKQSVFITKIWGFIATLLMTSMVSAAPSDTDRYLINAGDVIAVHVWHEKELSLPQILVRPDGYISLPILGELKAGGLTVTELQLEVTEKLKKYLKDEPAVSISIIQLSGNQVHVLGKVNRPGPYVMHTPTDVSQALAMAGGISEFADENDIVILRRGADKNQTSIHFNYGHIKDGKKLQNNILLKAGDVIVVP